MERDGIGCADDLHLKQLCAESRRRKIPLSQLRAALRISGSVSAPVFQLGPALQMRGEDRGESILESLRVFQLSSLQTNPFC